MVADVPPGPPPWMLPTPDVSFTPTSKSELPSLQQQLALEHIETVTSSITASTLMAHCRWMVQQVVLFSRLTWSHLQGAGLAVVSVTTLAQHCVNCMPFWMLLVLFVNVE
ncbi:hypothetical protein Pcinc_009920 [Petrolisthes cinctipes]|uniref:Uncharacterized protein n=1 Tax=Petrolisthes cinctipes TaxID=88211 RepID=A0AAE1G6I2_PETCI|nr:hypothetical protein Pcinc_009920 [Petrolisthes cinctipes]